MAESPIDSINADFAQASGAQPSAAPAAAVNQDFEQAAASPAPAIVLPQAAQLEAPKPSNSKPINVYNPDGDLVSIPGDRLQDAVSQGYREASQEEIDHHFKEEKYGSAGQQVIAGLEGAAQGIAGPFATAAEVAMGVPGEDIRGREEINPWTSGVSKAGGLAASMLTGFGEAAILGKAGAAASAAALGIDGAKGASLLAKIGAKSASEAAQMAVLQGGDEISKMITADPNQSVGTAVANVGLASILGGGAGVVFGAAPPAWRALVGNKADQMIGDFKGRMKWHLENPNPVEAVGKELTEHYQSVKSMADEVYGAQGLKAQEISKVMPEMSEKIGGWANTTVEKLEKAIQKMENNPSDYPESLVDKLKNKIEQFKSISSPGIDPITMKATREAVPGDIFNAAQDLKQQLQEWSKFNKSIVPLAEHDFRSASKGLAFDIRTALEDSSVWGKAAERQQAINGAFKEYLPTLKDFERKFTTEIAGERVIDPSKINTYMNQLGKPNAELKQEMLSNFLKASEKYQDVISKTHANLGLESPTGSSSLAVTKSTLDQLPAGTKLADVVVKKGLARLGGDVAGAGIGGAIGHTVGAPGWGAIIGEHALGPFLSSAMPALIKPILEGINNSAGLRAASEYAVSVAKGEAAMAKAAKSVFKSDAKVLSEKLMPSEGERVKLDNRLKELRDRPEEMEHTANDLNHYLPGHGIALSETAAKAVQYLNSLRPDTSRAFPLSPQRVPSSSEKAQYNRALNIAQQPLTVVANIQQGSITNQDVQTLKTLYPGLYQRMSQKLTDSMMDSVSKGNNVPYKTRLGLSAFLGQPLDGSMTPQAILSAQPKPQGNQGGGSPQQGGSGVNRPKRGTATLSKLPGQYQTKGQSAEADQLKD